MRRYMKPSTAAFSLLCLAAFAAGYWLHRKGFAHGFRTLPKSAIRIAAGPKPFRTKTTETNRNSTTGRNFASLSTRELLQEALAYPALAKLFHPRFHLHGGRMKREDLEDFGFGDCTDRLNALIEKYAEEQRREDQEHFEIRCQEENKMLVLLPGNPGNPRAKEFRQQLKALFQNDEFLNIFDDGIRDALGALSGRMGINARMIKITAAENGDYVMSIRPLVPNSKIPETSLSLDKQWEATNYFFQSSTTFSTVPEEWAYLLEASTKPN